MSEAIIDLPPKLVPVFTGAARYRGAYGGRGSGKTRTFAKMTAIHGYRCGASGQEGQILCAREFMNSLDESSLEEIKAAIASEPFLAEYYEVGEKYIRSKDGRIRYTFSGLRHNLDSIKSKARILLCWVDEAEPVSAVAWRKLIPTIREEGSEIWVTWNPERKNSETHKRFRESPPAGAKIVELNWKDNPWFPSVLEQERVEDFTKRPEQYQHVWEGDFVTVIEGAYYAQHIADARNGGRIGNVAADPLMTIRAIWDIGGTGAKADACAIWVAQYVGREIRWLDYYEAVGQPLATHVAWLRDSGYAKALCVLPHDGATNDRVHDVSYESALRAAGFEVQVIANQGAGAAMKRVEAARRLFPSMWFNEKTTEAGIDAIGWYHEKRDDERGIGLGPEHDWSSHGCFHGDTEILTRYGTQRIMDLPENGEVLTPCGWKQYINPRMTKRSARLVEVEFTDGLTVKCTPDHLFLTVSGWKSAESLTPHTVIQSTLTKSRNTSTAVSTACGQARRIYRGAASAFTEMFGRLPLGRSQGAATFTTGTETYLTTASTISNVCPHRSTFRSLGQSAPNLRTAGSAKRPETRPQSGTHPLRVGFGTAATQSALRHGPSGNASQRTAHSVVQPLTLWFGKVGTLKSIAALLARLLRTGSAGSNRNMNATVERVRQISETADVWDITVPDGHWFSLANGAVVHNSDAFGLGAVAYELPKDGTKEPEFRRRKVV